MKRSGTSVSSKYDQNQRQSKDVCPTAGIKKRNILEKEHAAYSCCAESKSVKTKNLLAKNNSSMTENNHKYHQRKANYELNIKNIPLGTVRKNLVKFINSSMRDLELCKPDAIPIVFCRRPKKSNGRLTTFVHCATLEDLNGVLSLDGTLFQGYPLSIYKRNHEQLNVLDHSNKLNKDVYQYNSSIAYTKQEKHFDAKINQIPSVLEGSIDERMQRQLIKSKIDEHDDTNLKEASNMKLSMLEVEATKALIKTHEAKHSSLTCTDITTHANNEMNYLSQRSKTVTKNSDNSFGNYFNNERVVSQTME